MYKKLLVAFVALILCYSYVAKAQDTTRRHGCGLNPDYLLSMHVDSPGHGVTALYTSVGAFPPVAVIPCGKFMVYFEDLIPGAALGGFSEPGGIGATRRSTLCDVLNYIQTVYDFSNIPPGKYIRLHVDASWSAARPMTTTMIISSAWPFRHGVCSPLFKTSSISAGALLNGFVHDYIKSGIDPNPGDYHANLEMNFYGLDRNIFDFSRGYRVPVTPLISPIDYNNGTGSVVGCQFDLYSVLLHMVSHTLGWFSWKDFGGIHGLTPSALPQSNYDGELSGISNPKTTSNPFSTMVKLAPTFGTHSRVLLNNKIPPYNYFVYNKDPSSGISDYSHLIKGYFSTSNRITPGDLYNPVMALPFTEGSTSREYTKGELLHFRDVIGLTIKTSFSTSHSTLLNNRLAWSSKMNSDAYNFTYSDQDFAEKVIPDYTLINDIGSFVDIDLNADGKLHDADGDQLSVMPGTLVNFRGCGNGGNNHNQLTLSVGDKVITYTPRHNFYGRAQFGFNLWDGKEKGAFVIYTIDVKPGTNVSAPLGTEIIVNGNFEEGDEVKIKTTDENINNAYISGPLTTRDDGFRLQNRGRFNLGITMSDGHPYDAFTNFYYGTAIRNSFAECSYAANNLSFGHPATSFPWSASWTTVFSSSNIWATLHARWHSDGFPESKVTGSTNNRYQPLGQDGILLNLAEQLKDCRVYILEFDARRTYGTPPTSASHSYTYPTTDQLILDCTESSLITDLSTITSIKNYTFPIPKIDDKNWEHFKVRFTYCAGSPSNVLRLKISGAFADNETIATVLLDNVSLIETPFALSIKIIDDPKQGCNRTIYAGPPSVACPTMTYEWKDATGAVVGTSRGLAISALDNTFYTVTVSDGCSTATDRIDIEPCPCSPVIVLTKPYTTLTTGTVPSVLAPGKYYVPADIVLSGTTDFNNVIMLIEPNVQIAVPNTAKLTIDNSHLFTCPDTTKLWKGISLATTGSGAGGTSARIEVKNNSLIEDAYTAIDAQNIKAPPSGDIINVTNSIFNRNGTDININNGYSLPTAGTYPISITGNVFTARLFKSTKPSGYPFLWPSSASLSATTTPDDASPNYFISKNYDKAYRKDGIFSYLGVQVQNVGTTFGGGTSFAEVVIGGGSTLADLNLYDNHRYGIHSNNSNTSIYNSAFIHISKRMEPSSLPHSSTLPDWGGAGIVARTSNPSLSNRVRMASKAGTVGNLVNRFFDCWAPIYVDKLAYLILTNAVITSSHKLDNTTPGAAYPWEIYRAVGIEMFGSPELSSWEITNNEISNMNSGIYAYLNNPKAGAVININNNKLFAANNNPLFASYTADQYMLQGIEAFSPTGGTATNTLNINANAMIKVFNGIYCNGLRASKTTVQNNSSIDLWDVTMSSPNAQFGIRMESCLNAQVSNNAISTPTLGAVLYADRMNGIYASFNTGLSICSNTTNKIGRGFSFDQKTPQVGTRWIGNNINDGYKGFVLGSDIGDQGFMYNGLGTMPLTYYGATGNKWTGTWSLASSKYQTVGLDYTNTMLSKLYVKNIPSGVVERPTINEAIPSGSPLPYYYSFGASILTSTATQMPDANCMGGLLPTKYKPLALGGGPKKGLGFLIMSDATGYGTDYRPSQWMAQMALYELGIVDPEMRDSIGSFDSFMLAAANSRFAWIGNIETALANGQTAQAQALLNSPAQAMGRVVISPDVIITDYAEANPVVDNYKDYYKVYLKYLSQQALTASDSNLLSSLAAKCPAIDGAAVYKARGLYRLLTGIVGTYNDDGCYYGHGGQFRIAPPDTEPTDEEQYSLYPNPNNGSFVIALSSLRDKHRLRPQVKQSVKVYNALGILVYQENLSFSNGAVSVNLGQQAQGLYLVCIDNGGAKPTCLRFIIQ